MNLKLTVKEKILNSLNITDYFYAVNFDIVNNCYVKGVLIVDNEFIYVVVNDELLYKLKIKQFDDINMATTMEGGYIYGKKGNVETVIVSCSKHYYEKIASVALGLNLFLHEGFMALSDIAERHCPKCGTPYPKGSTLCSYCGKASGTVKYFLPFLKKYAWVIIFQLIIMGLSIFFETNRPRIFESIVNDYLIKQVFDSGFVVLLLEIVATYMYITFSRIIRGQIEPIITNGISHDIRLKVYDKVQKLTLSSASNKTTGSLITRVSNDTSNVQNFLSQQLISTIYCFAEAIVLLIIMGISDYKLTLLIIIPIPIVLFITNKLWAMSDSKYYKRWKYLTGTNNTLHDILSGIKVVKTYGMEKQEVKKFRKANELLKGIDIQTEKFWNTFTPIIFFLLGFGQVIIYYYVGNKIIGGELDYGAMLKWASYSGMLYSCADILTNFPRGYLQFSISANKIMEILEEPTFEDSGLSCPNIKGNVRFENVRFGYLSFTPVLKDISFDVKSGETIGIVGYSGSGKTTLINLIMKLYAPNHGKIIVDGIDISTLDSMEYRKKLGVVLQETFLFSGTIKQNIAYGKKDATDEEIIRVCKMAHAHDFILEKPFGYDTKLGHKGDGLSGGEKQRIAIARALLLNPSIFILDEATSSLDTITEKEIQDAITEITKNKTTFIIAHRLSTLQNASRLIVLNEGKMVEFGTHEELLAKKGYYYGLVEAQYMNYEKK